MARVLRSGKLDTRSARAKVPAKKSGYWVPIARGFALGYRRGPKGGSWLARLIESERRHETTLGPADDVLDADGQRILDYAQAQGRREIGSRSSMPKEMSALIQSIVVSMTISPITSGAVARHLIASRSPPMPSFDRSSALTKSRL
jgi:hypothetical protein